MSDFSAYGIADSGLDENRAWLDAIGDNIANINTVKPTSQAAFQARYIEAQAVNGTYDPASPTNSETASVDAAIGNGVAVTGVALGSPQGQLVYDPNNPLADSKGMVRYPDIDLSQQMTQLIMAQRGYEANLAVVTRATQAYQSALGLTV